eukprot:scaffold650920_cov42-Prasinocladus_malaysianus.AAC.1
MPSMLARKRLNVCMAFCEWQDPVPAMHGSVGPHGGPPGAQVGPLSVGDPLQARLCGPLHDPSAHAGRAPDGRGRRGAEERDHGLPAAVCGAPQDPGRPAARK